MLVPMVSAYRARRMIERSFTALCGVAVCLLVAGMDVQTISGWPHELWKQLEDIAFIMLVTGFGGAAGIAGIVWAIKGLGD